jgi:hypothetical protein
MKKLIAVVVALTLATSQIQAITIADLLGIKCIDTPPGTIIMFAGHGHKVPEGYLPCDGKEYAISEYGCLFEAISMIYGEGSVRGYFKVPDLRGMFLRCAGGNAAPLGQQQNDAIRNIEGQFWGDRRTPKGAFNYTGEKGGTYGGHGEGGPCRLNFSAAEVVPTADENRPVNYAVNVFIKYEDFCRAKPRQSLLKRAFNALMSRIYKI